MDKDDIKKSLSEKAYAFIEELKKETLSEAVGQRVRKFHAQGTATKHKKGMTLGQKARNTGVASETKRKKSAIKTMKTKKKKYGSVMPNKVKRKVARAKAKRPGA